MAQIECTDIEMSDSSLQRIDCQNNFLLKMDVQGVPELAVK